MDWIPRLIDWLICKATAKLPEEDKIRFGEEWRSHVNDVSQTIEKLYLAVGFNIAAHRLASRRAHKLGQDAPYALSTEYDDLYFELASCCPSLEGEEVVVVIDMVVVDEATETASSLAATIHRKSCPNHQHLAHRSLAFRSRTASELAILDLWLRRKKPLPIFF